MVYQLKVEGKQVGYFKSSDYEKSGFTIDLKDSIQKHCNSPYQDIALSLIAQDMQKKDWDFKVLCVKQIEYFE